ncbi:MAG: ATP-binding protein [Polyangia bacterium]
MASEAAHTRYLTEAIERDLARRMVLLSGPRQVGKTTVAKKILGRDKGYLNWDVAEDRERILRRQFPPAGLWVLDEIHKFRGWRNYLKGLWDGRRAGQRILVTGSAKLELYRFGGDSLQGRYHLLRLHPLSVAELGLAAPAELRDLLTLGGFPEPYFSGSEVEAKRWSREYRNLIVREEMTSLERVVDLGRVEQMMLRLPDLVASPLSVNSLREDLQISHKVAEHWLQILERLQAIFRIPPFGALTIRAVKKERKHYQLDWTLVQDKGPRFENLVACHLAKWVDFQQDVLGRDLELRYFRDVDGREVDFVLCERGKAKLLVECKWGDDDIARGLSYMKARFAAADAWQISATGKKDYVTPEGIRVAPALAFLRGLI